MIRIICGLCCQKQASQAGISNCIPQNTVGYNYISLPEIPASGIKGLIYRFRHMDYEEQKYAKTHASQQGSRKSASDWLVAVPLANQKSAPELHTNQHAFQHRILLETQSQDNITVLGYLCMQYLFWMYESDSMEVSQFLLWNILFSELWTLWVARLHAMTYFNSLGIQNSF